VTTPGPSAYDDYDGRFAPGRQLAEFLLPKLDTGAAGSLHSSATCPGRARTLR
jgi:hypothetical protein